MWSTIQTLGTAILTLTVLIYLYICLVPLDICFHMAGAMFILSACLHYLLQSLEHAGLTPPDSKVPEREIICDCVHHCFSLGPSTERGTKRVFNTDLWNKWVIGSHTAKLVESLVHRSKEFWLCSLNEFKLSQFNLFQLGLGGKVLCLFLHLLSL